MKMETTVVKEQALEKQIGGCMAGFFNIFDRPHLLSPKRFALPKRLSSSSSSPLISKTAQHEPSSSPLDSGNQSVYSTPHLRSPAPDENLPASSELKQGSSRSPWRFSREAPRLSLDSRAVVDAKGSLEPRQIRTYESGSGSPSVIARLMGLDALPASQQPLQRSASESRVSRFSDSFNVCRDDDKTIRNDTGRGEDDQATDFLIGRAQPARAPPPPPPKVSQRYIVKQKSVFDSADFFPEHRQTSGFDSPAPTTDLETLKQLLEALRLKGLLHSSSSSTKKHHGGISNSRQSPFKSRIGITSETSTGAGVSPSRRDQSIGRRQSTSENSVKSPNGRPTLKERRRSEPFQTRNRTRRGGGRPIEDDQCSSTQAEKEMWKVYEYNRQGKSLLERCDKLLHSIAEMAASEAAGDSQPSPVSVLDASLYHDESSPSPVMKRSLDFTESEDESWGGFVSSSSSDSEYVYISDILRASDCLPQECDIFSLLEKNQHYLKGKCVSAQERRLIFDAVQEIIRRIRRLSPWVMVGYDKMQLIWSEFQKIRKKRSSTTEEEDLVGYVCGVLGRDLSEDSWPNCQVEMSEAVLDIERLLFKDLIGETIGHMAALHCVGGGCSSDIFI